MNINLLISYLFALGIPLVALFLIRALDQFKSTHTSTLIYCILWGALPAFGLAYLLNNAILSAFITFNIGDYNTVVRLTAPILEEILKAAFLIFLISQPRFRYFVDGAIYGFCIGIGFAVLENFFYLSRGGGAVLALAISRGLSTSMMHAMCSAVVGISIGRLRRSDGGWKSRFLPMAGILIAIIVHVIYNNVVNQTQLSPMLLLLIAITIGVGGAGFIGLQITTFLAAEKRAFSQTLGAEDSQADVSMGEVLSIQRLGSDSAEKAFTDMRAKIGDENAAQVRKLLLTQANIGILKNNLASASITPRLRTAWEKEIAQLQDDFQTIRHDVDQPVQSYMQTMFPTEDASLWAWLQNDLADSDPTRVHTFDMFMRTSGLAATFTPEQLEQLAEKLSQIDIFKEIDLAELENLGRAVETKTFPDGTMLFDEGDEGDAMYLIVSGSIAVYALDAQRDEKLLRTFNAGQVVGDFAVLDGQPRSARARASGVLTALVLQRGLFQMFIQSRPQVISAVLKVLADKARYTTTALENSIRSASLIAQGHYSAFGGAPAAAVKHPVALAEPVLRPAGVPVVASSALRRIAGQPTVDMSSVPDLRPVAPVLDVPLPSAGENMTELTMSVTTSLEQAFAKLAASLQVEAPTTPADSAS